MKGRFYRKHASAQTLTEGYNCTENVRKKPDGDRHCPAKFVITKEANVFVFRGCAYHNHDEDFDKGKIKFSSFSDAEDFVREEGLLKIFRIQNRQQFKGGSKYGYFTCRRSGKYVAKIKSKKCACPSKFSLSEADNGQTTFSGHFDHNHGPDGIQALSDEEVKEVTVQVKDGSSVDQVLERLGIENPSVKADVEMLQRFHAPASIVWSGPNLTRITELVKKQDILTKNLRLVYSSSSETEDLLAAELSRLVKMGFHLQELERDTGDVDYLVTLNGSHQCGPPSVTKCLLLCEKCPDTNCEKEGRCRHLHISALLITVRDQGKSGVVTKHKKRNNSSALKSYKVKRGRKDVD
jgi:hypothetical protein